MMQWAIVFMLAMAGVVIEVPVKDPANAARVHDYDSEKLFVYLKDLTYDGDGRPLIL